MYSSLTKPAPAPTAPRRLEGAMDFPAVRAAAHRVPLAGWGGTARASAEFVEPDSPRGVRSLLCREGTTLRGLGRSYGDAAIGVGGRVIGLGHLDRLLAFDPELGVLRCEAGVSLETIIEHFAPRGWFPMITPGTKFVTVGGCIAADVHGKAHHVQGTFSSCVEDMTILLASGRVARASREENPELFWATFGGMGLLGVILTATLRLRRIETTYFRQKSVVAKDLEGMLRALSDLDATYPYSVATLDVTARGAQLGRGVLTVGDHAHREELPRALAAEPLRVGGRSPLALPVPLPNCTLNAASIRVVNAIIQQVLRRAPSFGHYEQFFYPLDAVGNWNRGYGRRGFIQYQFVIPFSSGVPALRRILDTIFSSGELPFLNVFKRFGKASGGLLSFPREGYTLAIDFPLRAGTAALAARLDELVLDAGGRVYLAKDSFLTATMFRAMYPEVERWLTLKAQYDPQGVFTSALAKRVGLA